MQTFEVTFAVSVEASDQDDAEEIVIEMLEAEGLEEWRIIRQEKAI